MRREARFATSWENPSNTAIDVIVGRVGSQPQLGNDRANNNNKRTAQQIRLTTEKGALNTLRRHSVLLLKFVFAKVELVLDVGRRDLLHVARLRRLVDVDVDVCKQRNATRRNQEQRESPSTTCRTVGDRDRRRRDAAQRIVHQRRRARVLRIEPNDAIRRLPQAATNRMSAQAPQPTAPH